MHSTRRFDPYLLAAALVVLGLALPQQPAWADSKKEMTLTEKDHNKTVQVDRGTTLVVKLPQLAGSPFRWRLGKVDDALLKPEGKAVVEKHGPSIEDKVMDLQVFRFQAKAAGISVLELHYTQPKSKYLEPYEKNFRVKVAIH